jgi:dsRNA-specific ribonuclease
MLSVSDQDEIVTGWFVAAKVKTAEQAAAEAVLQQLSSEPSPEATPVTAAVPTEGEATSQPPSGRNAVSALNELMQAGLLQAAGYELLDQSGPSHQPTFTTVAWATLPDGRTLRTEPVNGPSKKSGQRAAADRLLDLLVLEGVTRR